MNKYLQISFTKVQNTDVIDLSILIYDFNWEAKMCVYLEYFSFPYIWSKKITMVGICFVFCQKNLIKEHFV